MQAVHVKCTCSLVIYVIFVDQTVTCAHGLLFKNSNACG